ncbi:MAG: sulfurtransferase TusA family protein [Candidatus Sulfobium sp.]|jgi:tRNA 2-thiouridine synthesizing protein A
MGEGAETHVDKSINIKGLVCPYTFVKAKLAIESMEVGQVLEILLDYEEASRSIPKSMEDHGQKVLKVEKINDTDWKLLIRKDRE